MRFASIGSGSRGNGTLVEAGETCLLVDCGFSIAETKRRMERLGKAPEELSAILVTHEHGDHIRGVAPLARRYQLPVWMTAGTALVSTDCNLPHVEWINTHATFTVGDVTVSPFTVPHDAREPSQFVFSHGQFRLGLLTDVGCITEHICRSLDGVDALILEANHDEALLSRGPYPPSLKKRVGGRLGHLNNLQAADLLRRMDTSNLQSLVAAHISEKNNHIDIVRDALVAGLDQDPDWLILANQEDGFEWRQLA